MDLKKLERRNSSLDILRIFAVFTVISVHFFLHNGFYSETVNGMGPIEGLIDYFSTSNEASLHGPIMFIMVQMRTLFSVCVPLFMILTGYLMCKKTVSRKYYIGIRKTLIVFVLATIFCMLFKAVHEDPAAKNAFYQFNVSALFSAIEANDKFTFKGLLLSTLDFTGANYSWYIEMYIGLFFIAPFLNLAYNGLKNKKQKQALLATFITITILPSLLNIFNFNSLTWWTNPPESDSFQKLVPSWWMGIYPITYYFTGCYIREFGIKLKTKSMIILFVITQLIFGSFNFYRSYGTNFKSGIYVFWYGFEPYILSTLLFVLISRIKTENWSNKVKFGLWKLSDLALGAYLMSYVADMKIYETLNASVPVMTDRLPYYFVTVPASFLCAMLMSAVLNILADLIVKGYYKLKEAIKKDRAKGGNIVWQDFTFAALMMFGILFAFWKSDYGFGGNDEAFYLTVPHRIILGDSFIGDEWHLSQLSGFLLMPFVWLYRTIFGGTVGILPAFRILYIILHAAASVFIYTRVRKFGYIATIGTWLYFIYTPYDIMALSYDTMGLELVTLTGVIAGTADYTKKLPLIFAGLTFAGAVLCNPYLALVYALFGICVIIHLIIKNKNTNFVLKSKLFAPKSFLFFTIGVAILAALFLILALTRISVSEVLKNLPYLFTDPDHPSIPFTKRLSSYFESIFKCSSLFKYSIYGYAAMLVVMIFDKNRKRHRSLYLIASTAAVIFSLVLFLPELTTTKYNAIMYPMIFLSVTSYILCEKKPRELFAGLFVLGIIYSVAIHFTSNQYFYVISMATAASNVSGYVFLGQLIREIRETPDNIEYAVWVKRSSFALLIIMLSLQTWAQITVKAEHVFWDQTPANLTSEITVGPAKGIYTTEANKRTYEDIYNDIQASYSQKTPDKILYLTEKTWCYLATDEFPYGTLSAWISGERDSSLERLKTYYSVNPEKLPRYIYIPKAGQWNFQLILNDAQLNGYKLTETGVSYQLEKI